MSEEMRKNYIATIENLKHLDREGLIIIKSASDVLKARQLMDETDPDPEDEKQQKIA